MRGGVYCYYLIAYRVKGLYLAPVLLLLRNRMYLVPCSCPFNGEPFLLAELGILSRRRSVG